jgi:hypothetical protein
MQYGWCEFCAIVTTCRQFVGRNSGGLSCGAFNLVSYSDLSYVSLQLSNLTVKLKGVPMRNLLLSACLVLLALPSVALVRHRPVCAMSSQMQSSVPTQTALAVIRAAQSSLNAQLGHENTLTFYYNQYYDATLTVESLGVIDGKDWYKVSYGGGSVILGIDEEV